MEKQGHLSSGICMVALSKSNNDLERKRMKVLLQKSFTNGIRQHKETANDKTCRYTVGAKD
jgi:hypothetical protein